MTPTINSAYCAVGLSCMYLLQLFFTLGLRVFQIGGKGLSISKRQLPDCLRWLPPPIGPSALRKTGQFLLLFSEASEVLCDHIFGQQESLRHPPTH